MEGSPSGRRHDDHDHQAQGRDDAMAEPLGKDRQQAQRGGSKGATRREQASHRRTPKDHRPCQDWRSREAVDRTSRKNLNGSS